MRVALAAYGIAGCVHFLTERIGDGIGADGAEAVKLACHFRNVNGGQGLSPVCLFR